MAKRTPKPPKRDPNVPVASWKAGGTTYQVRYTGPGESCKAQYNPKHTWGGKTPSLIISEIDTAGIREREVDPYDLSTWGWLVRLITDDDMDRSTFKAITPTDKQVTGK